jgi:hypothetical protein
LSYSFIFHKQVYFIVFCLKITGYGNPNNNLESPCTSLQENYPIAVCEWSMVINKDRHLMFWHSTAHNRYYTILRAQLQQSCMWHNKKIYGLIFQHGWMIIPQNHKLANHVNMVDLVQQNNPQVHHHNA